MANKITMIVGPHTLMVQTTDMDRSVAFYRDVLRLEPGYVSAYWSDFLLGGIRLGVHPVFEGNEAPAVIPFKNAILGIEVTDIRDFREVLESAGDFVRGDFHQTPSGIVLNFVDPEGNNFQAIQPGTKISPEGNLVAGG